MDSISSQDIMNCCPEEWEAYENHLKRLRVKMNALKKAEEKGYEQGVQKSKLEAAKKMAQQGFSSEQITQIIGLSKQELEQLCPGVVRKQDEPSKVYPNNLKNWEFGKEVPQNFCSERATIAQGQGASENENYEVKPTPPKTNFSSCLGI